MILVTGGAGYIGSHVVRQITEAGSEVVVFDNLSTGSADALVRSRCARPYGEELVMGDLADPGARARHGIQNESLSDFYTSLKDQPRNFGHRFTSHVKLAS